MIDLLADRLGEASARGLASAISQVVGDGTLAPGTRLPPIRTVAAALGLSPTTVSAAWQLLSRSGVIRTGGRRGTVIAPRRATGPRRYRSALAHHASFRIDLSTGMPDPALLPDLHPALGRLATTAPASYLDEPVVPQLEQHLRAQLPAGGQRLAIFDGAMDTIDLVASSVLKLGDRVVVENPTFPPLLDLLDALGAELIGVELDSEGPREDSFARALAAGPSLICLQPRAQNPTGVSWSEARAARLVELVARAPNALIVEDDSAGDIATSALRSMCASHPDRTVHIRSFAKSHGPDLRLAAAIGPARVLDPIMERRLLGQGWTSRLLQHLLLDLLTDPRSVDAVEAAKREYARRRQLIVAALPGRGAGIGELSSGDGLNLWLPVPDEHTALIGLASAGIGAAAGRPFQVSSAEPMSPHIRVTAGLVAQDHTGVAGALARVASLGTRRTAY